MVMAITLIQGKLHPLQALGAIGQLLLRFLIQPVELGLQRLPLKIWMVRKVVPDFLGALPALRAI